MSAELKRLIKNLPKKSLEAYFAKFHADLVDDFDWSEDEKAVKKSLKEICLALIGEPFALMNARAERIDALTGELGQSMLFLEIEDSEIEEYSSLKNAYDRATWLFLKNDSRFTLNILNI
jgi:erythromycin esterase-like protein